MNAVAKPDFIIVGGGLIGLTLALELEARGASVMVLEAGQAMAQASTAAAGMLAVEDPAHPAALRPLARLSGQLYPSFLDRLEDLGGVRVPFQTFRTLQAVEPDSSGLPVPGEGLKGLAPEALRFHELAEHSVDPLSLAEAVLAAVRNTRIELHENTPLTRLQALAASVRVEAGTQAFEAGALIDCMGAWSPAPVSPRKGQMLAVKLPPDLRLDTVVRTSSVYVVPRTAGPRAGQAIIGATVEDVGFDWKVHPLDILTLNAHASCLLPALGRADFVEAWSGLRPATSDGLPILGSPAGLPRYFVANGHFRNGILLAPGSARVMAQTLLGAPPALELGAFSPDRFRPAR